MALLFLFSNISFAGSYSYPTQAAAETACTAAYTAAAAPYGVPVNWCQLQAGVKRYFSLTVNGSLVASGDYYWDDSNCPTGTSPDPVTFECVIPPAPLDQLCENRPPILSDNEGDGYSYQGCNYHECGSVVNADAGTYNKTYCPQAGLCVDNILGCLPENTEPYSDDLTDGCMTIGGKTVCIDDEDPNNCYQVDGQSQCFKENSVCGTKNGTFQCTDGEQNGCGQFNGEMVCFQESESGEPEVVDPDSPDHPDNGGNLDGDDTNDVTDSRTTQEGGDPNKQPTNDKLTASDKKKSKLDAQNIVNEQLKAGMWESLPTGTGITDEVTTASDGVADGLLDMGQGVVDGVVNGNDGFGQTSALTGLQNNVLNPINVGSSCSSIPIVIPAGYGTYYIDCFYLDKTREFLSFLFYFLTVIGLFYILTRPMEAR
jgi:hypothetical protein